MFASPGGAVFLVLWFLELAAASEFALRKRRNQWTWVLATFVFGPIAFVLLLVLPRRGPGYHGTAA